MRGGGGEIIIYSGVQVTINRSIMQNILCTTLHNDIIMCMSYSESVSLHSFHFYNSVSWFLRHWRGCVEVRHDDQISIVQLRRRRNQQ